MYLIGEKLIGTFDQNLLMLNLEVLKIEQEHINKVHRRIIRLRVVEDQVYTLIFNFYSE